MSELVFQANEQMQRFIERLKTAVKKMFTLVKQWAQRFSKHCVKAQVAVQISAFEATLREKAPPKPRPLKAKSHKKLAKQIRQLGKLDRIYQTTKKARIRKKQYKRIRQICGRTYIVHSRRG